MRKETKIRLLTEVELELMTIIWKREPCVVRDVLEALPKERDVTYTTVAKMLKILEDKGVLTSQKGEKTHVYSAVLTREAYESRTLQHVADKLFDGSPSSMVMRLLDDSDISKDELQSIRKWIETRMRT